MADKTKKQEVAGKKSSSIKGIVRVCETNLDGNKKVSQAILRIRGIGHTLSSFIPNLAGIDSSKLLGELTEEEVGRLEDVIKNPLRFNVPEFLLNRRKDRETGESRHVVESESILVRKSDIDLMKKIRCYRGIRHERNLPVRGQRTRGSFRKGRSVGVSKKKNQPAKKGEKS